MNQALLTRLFKSIEGDKNSPLIKIAYSIIEEEKRKGHNNLVDKLNSILQNGLIQSNNFKPFLKVTREGDFKVPLDRRYRLPLAIHVEHEYFCPSGVFTQILFNPKNVTVKTQLLKSAL